MIIEKMLEVLPNTKWQFINNNEIVTLISSGVCPWVYAHDQGVFNNFSHEEYLSQCYKVYDAADNKEDHDPELRKKLLEACGLCDQVGGT